MRSEVQIRGAGPVGCVLALLLHGAGRPVSLQRAEAAPPSFRPIALSHASRLILERIGAWQGFAATPIDTVHVSQQGAFGRARMSAADAGVPALGYVVQHRELLQALTYLTEKIPDGREEPGLVVHAEGVSGEARERRYGHEAVVARVTAEPPAAGTAFERFTAEGPLALLPLEGGYCVVWGMAPERARHLAEADQELFLEALGAAFGRRAGRFTSVRERARVPLALRVRPSRVGEREAFVGNAAQTLHPVAGQGLNLGLRDAWDLAQALRDAADPGDAQVLGHFAASRRFDAAATVRVTDFLAGAFLGANPIGAAMRGIGLTALDMCLPARRFFARRMIFGATAIP